MANLKISDLPSAASATSGQQFEVNDAGVSKKVTGSQILAYVESEITTDPTFTGQVSVADGTAAAPSITNTGDTNTGIYFSNPDEIGLVTGGTTRVTVNSSGDVITTGNIELGHATDTTISRAAAGVISVEGNRVPSPASQAQGDILYRGATDWERLPAGSSGQFLKTNGSGANPSWVNPSYSPDVIIEDQKSSGVDGGTFSSAADRTRTLNTLVYNANSLATLSSNQFTLPAGTYYIEWSCPAYAVNGHQSMLYNVTAGLTVKRGTTAYGSNTTSVQTDSHGNATVINAGNATFEIRHRCVTSRATEGFGFAANLGTEVYTTVKIWKIA